MSYDIYKLSCNDETDLARAECANCGSGHLRAGEMIEVAGELVCSSACLDEYQAEHLCADCGKHLVRNIIRTDLGIFCSSECIDRFVAEIRAEMNVLPKLYETSTDSGFWRKELVKVLK